MDLIGEDGVTVELIVSCASQCFTLVCDAGSPSKICLIVEFGFDVMYDMIAKRNGSFGFPDS
jgi:hypothetical protein